MKTNRFALAAAAAMLAFAGMAHAATITVNSFLDNGANCTLRKAIENANAGGSVHAACTSGTTGSNTIVLGTGTYLFTANPNGPYNLLNNNITLQGNGPGNTIIDGQNQDYLFDNFGSLAETNITITFSGLTITRGQSIGFSGFDVAGAMFVEFNATAFLDNVAFVDNVTTASGGAIANFGNMTVNNSTFSGNTASSGEGGAIRNAGNLVVTNSTFNGNSATSGGAIYHTGDDAGEALNVTNSTFSGNTAITRGGAIATNNPASGGAVTLTHVTIANNAVTGGTGGGIYRNQSAGFNIDRSIIANNTAAAGPDCNSTSSFNSLDYNVIGTTTGCTIAGTTAHDFVGAVTLNALASNGGPTQTIALPAFSPARDRAPTCATGTDQRGTARPLGAACDSGAFEAGPSVPQAPAIGTATAGNAEASITFTAGANGGATITSYTMTSNPGGIIGTGSASPIVVSGLTNGTAYTFTVTATNSTGTSPASAASNSVTPVGPPPAPTIGLATAGNSQASVAFEPPVTNGGSAITGYTATSSPGGLTASGLASPLVVTGLTNGVAYTFTVRATNSLGQGPASAASNSVVPFAAFTPTSDFNGDGKPDLLWSNTANGATYVWYMDGLVLISDAFIALVDPSWKVQGVADFNGDLEPDIVWRNTASGDTFVWYMDGPSLVSDAFLFNLPPEWVIQGVADFNGDGSPDFLLRNTTTGIAFAWFFDDATAIGDQYLFQIDPSWKVEAVADLNGDTQPDLLFRSMASGLAFTWFTQYSGGTLSLAGSSPEMFSIDPVWEIVQLEDWNGDGNRDLLFRNRDTGVVLVWYMTGTTLGASDFIIQIDPSWEIVPRR